MESTPAVFKGGKVENIEIVRDIVGFRPERTGGIRVEKDVLNGQKVVHAYGKYASVETSKPSLTSSRSRWHRIHL